MEAIGHVAGAATEITGGRAPSALFEAAARKGTEMFEPEKLPAPDEMGFFLHPDIPGGGEGDDVRALCDAVGFTVNAISMEIDAPELCDAWFDEDMTAPTRWAPTPPNGVGWMLVAKYDTEEGPCVLFVQPKTPVDHSCQ